MIAAFCERLYWSDYAILFLRINEKLTWCVKDELLDLMSLPSLRPERARALYNAGLQSVEQVSKDSTIEGLVKIFAKNDGFVSHRKSNEGDLRLKYDYLYTLAHKVCSEAKMIMIKRKVDPDRTATSYLQEHLQIDQHDYIIESESSFDSVDIESVEFLSIGSEDDIESLDSVEYNSDVEDIVDLGIEEEEEKQDNY